MPVEDKKLIHTTQTLVALAHVYKQLYQVRKTCDIDNEARSLLRGTMEVVAETSVSEKLRLAGDPSQHFSPINSFC
nr:MAG TPA: hypothetical protein [Caudoviricetes sp.]